MNDDSQVYLTRLADGRAVTTEELVPLVYRDLKRIAGALFASQQREVTLQPTALVNEAYMALTGGDEGGWENRAEFLAVAARAMRTLLIDSAKSRGRQKRGGGWQKVTLSGAEFESGQDPLSLIDLDQALKRLAEVSERRVRIVELRYFAGMTLHEVAEVLGVSRTIIVREWVKTKEFLAVELKDSRPGPDDCESESH